MDVEYRNTDELTALNSWAYIPYWSLHSLTCLDSGAKFESRLCSLIAHILLLKMLIEQQLGLFQLIMLTNHNNKNYILW